VWNIEAKGPELQTDELIHVFAEEIPNEATKAYHLLLGDKLGFLRLLSL
jgi:hypothetical protein